MKIYYLPGRDKDIFDRVGQAIYASGFDLVGRDLLPDFIHYRIARQVDIIKHDIIEYFSDPGSVLIARSYGAFLLLQSLLELKSFQGRILLLCPVLGPTKVEAGGTMFFKPPRGYKLLTAAREGSFPVPGYMEIHTGTEDLQCPPENAEEFSGLVKNTRLKLIKGAGHSLDQVNIEKALELF